MERLRDDHKDQPAADRSPLGTTNLMAVSAARWRDGKSCSKGFLLDSPIFFLILTGTMASSSWHTTLKPLPPTPLSLSSSELQNLASRAQKLHAEETASFTSKSSDGKAASEAAFFSKIVQSGTLSDRLSALTLMVQNSPLHNTKSLETLKAMAERGKGKGGREESLKALRCIVDWWVGGGAPDRKLK